MRCIVVLVRTGPVTEDPGADARAFAPVVERLERLVTGVQVVRPGLCVVRARGPARWYGNERAAALALVQAVAEAIPAGDDALIVKGAVADGPFTAERAARVGDPVAVVPEGESAAFLAPLPIRALGDPELVDLLPRLGVHTLGDFAALPDTAVRERFGARGAHLHALAAGRDSRPVIARTPPPELVREVAFEPPLTLVDQVAFGVRVTADEFIAGLMAARLVCTELLVAITSEGGERSERVWLHPAAFDTAAVVDRVRWQLAAAEVLTSGVVGVRLEPEAVDAGSHHEPGLFGSGTDERVHHALSRVQALVGHDGVVTVSVGGGRTLLEREVRTPWGDRPTPTQPRDRPWPGRLPDPLPSIVYRMPRTVDVLDADGAVVTVTDRGTMPAPPALLVAGTQRLRIIGWAGPWAIDQRGWDQARARAAHRIQVIDEGQRAWLLALDESAGGWFAEGRYD